MSHLSSIPARPTPHSSRRLSSNGSLSSLSELGMLDHHDQQQEQRRSSASSSGNSSSSNTSKTIPSSPNSSSSSSSNMMQKLGSRFTLKRKDNPTSSTAADDAIEELADENEVLATARPRAGRTLTSSNASTARPPSVYGDLQQSGGTNRLKHRSSLSNLNASSNSNASLASSGGGGGGISSVSRQPGTLRHRASISSLSGSGNGFTSPPMTALRQPGTLRHRSSISNLSASGSEVGATSPPSTITRQPGALRHRNSITSLSSVAMAKPTSSRPTTSSTAPTTISPPTRLRTMSTTTSASRASHFPSTSNNTANDSVNTSAINNSLSNSRRLSATHTGLAAVRTRTTSLMSPPKASLQRPTPGISSTAAGDTSIARRGIPKSSTTSISRLASTASSSSSSSVSMSHRRIGSLAGITSPNEAITPRPASTSSSSALKRIQKDSKVEDSPGLDELVNNTTLQMADLKDMLSPLAVSKVSNNAAGSVSRHHHYHQPSTSLSGGSKAATVTGAGTRPRLDSIRNTKSSMSTYENEREEEEELENVNVSPSKSALPVLQRATSIAARKAGSSSPSPTKIIRVKSASPKKVDKVNTGNTSLRMEGRKIPTPVSSLTHDGLPVIPGVRNLAPPVNTQPFPSSSSSSSSRRAPSPGAAHTSTSHISSSSLIRGQSAKRTPRSRSTSKRSSASASASEDEMERLLSEEGFISPARFLTADCSTLLMQDDLSNIMMTPLRAPAPSSTSAQNRGALPDELALMDTSFEGKTGVQSAHEVEVLLQAEREKIRKELLAQASKEKAAIEAKAAEEHKLLQDQLNERKAELLKASKEIKSLQRLLSSEANKAVHSTHLEIQLSKQEVENSSIRRLKRDFEDLQILHDREKKERIFEKSKDCWRIYGKELEIERELLVGQLEMLDSIRGLMGHIALCVEKRSVMHAGQIQPVLSA